MPAGLMAGGQIGLDYNGDSNHQSKSPRNRASSNIGSAATTGHSVCPENIYKNVIDELIVRFLINLPAEERKPPRLFQNIKEAGWFYLDNYFDGKTPKT
jgi:hypothetical protein